MDFPLNWAHQQDRKAEALVNHRKFADAIVCHQKASEFLQEAMKMTQVKQALVSLQLQANNHCRQQRILEEKWKRCKIEQEKRKQEQAKTLQERQNQELVESEIPSKVEEKTSTESVDGKTEMECLQSSSLVISAENFSVSSTSSSSDCVASRDEKSVNIKDLEGQVRDLQMQVLSLSQDLEDSNRENSRLRKALDNVQEFVKFKFGYELEDEMFDFNLVKSQCATESEEISHNTDLKIAAENDQRISCIQEDLKEPEQAVKEVVETADCETDEDISLPPLEKPQFNIHEDGVEHEGTT